MFYSFEVTVDANTAKASPKVLEMKLTRGVIHRVEVQFPIGLRGYVHAQIYQGGHQLWPTNPDGDFASDGYVIAWDEHYEFFSEPFILTAKCWSEADTYSHTLRFRIGILPESVIDPYSGIFGLLRKFLKMVGVGGA